MYVCKFVRVSACMCTRKIVHTHTHIHTHKRSNTRIFSLTHTIFHKLYFRTTHRKYNLKHYKPPFLATKIQHMFTSSHGFGCSACEKGRYRQRDKKTKKQRKKETKRQRDKETKDKETKTEAAAHTQISRHACACAVRDDTSWISV